MAIPDAAVQSSAASGGIAPLVALEALAERVEAKLLAAISAVPDLPADLRRVLPDALGEMAAALGPILIAAAAVVLALGLCRQFLVRRRRKAVAERNAFVGLVKLAGLELIALAAAILVGRVVLVRVLGIPPGTGTLPSETTTALIRWLMGMSLTIILFQPGVPRFRLAMSDDAGARKAVRRIGVLLAAGHLHIVLLDAAQRAGLPVTSAKLLSCLVGLGIAVGAVQLYTVLGQHGMKLAVRLAAIWLTLTSFMLWLWGWIVLDFDLYRGAVGTITVLLLALAVDRAVALSIRDSRRPDVMRLLFILRVVVDALAAMLIVRIIFDFWVIGAFAWLSADQSHLFSARLTIASAIIVVGATLAAVVHAWTEARMTPDIGTATLDPPARLSRLSTVLPIIRLAVITLIGVVFSLLALSALGVDVTALIAGAGILGLAISFGLQTMVKDVVTGMFHMLDDVFRLGETIEAAGKQGELERINLRSLRIRDEGGRLHTIPFGDLGTVSNHSRRLVRMTAVIPLAPRPTEGELLRFGRAAAAALRSEPMLNGSIVGNIGTCLRDSIDAQPSTFALSFTIAATTANRAQVLVQRLVEETVTETGTAGLSGAATITMTDLSISPEAQAPGPAGSPREPRTVDAMNMA